MENKELHRITATAIIYTPERKYLLTKRALHKKVMPGKWCVPGGGLSTDDYVNDQPSTNDGKQWYFALDKALRREVREEVNLEMGKLEYLLDLTFIRPDGVPVLCISYHAPYLSGEVKLDEDATEYVWATFEEAKGYDLIDGILDEIQRVEEILLNQRQ